MKDYINNIKNKKLFGLLLFTITIFWSIDMQAEGSKDLYPNGATGGRAFLLASTTESAAFPFPTLGTHYVYAEVGEQIALATSAQAWGTNNSTRNGNRQNIRLFGPNGQQITLTVGNNASTIGRIDDRTAELAGPQLPTQTGGNRYTPLYHTVTQAGIYKVEFLSTSGSETGNERISYVAANADWTQPNNSNYLAAWDISVAKQTGTTWNWVNGRVYTTAFSMDNQSYAGNPPTFTNGGFYGKFKVLTRDGYVYNVGNNGNQGISFTFMVNNRGFHTIGDPNTPSYKSIAANTAAAIKNRYHDPRNADAEAAVTQKIFYQLPDNNMPENANGAVPGGETWLRIPEKDLNVTSLTISGVEGSSNQIGSKGAYIEFYNESGGDYFITISPKAGSGNTFPTRLLTGSSTIGDNKIHWDGKDGNGNSLPFGLSDVTVELKLRGAEVHFPYIDMELNHNGIIIELLSTDLQSVRSDIVYWDDSDIRTVNTSTFGSMTNPRNASHTAIPTGTSSNSNGHIWGTGSDRATGTFGDEQGMDTWTFIEGDAISVDFDVDVKIADLEVVSITPNKNEVRKNEELTYTVVVRNNGPSDVEGATFTFEIPEGFDPENVIFNSNSCGAESVIMIYDAVTHTYTSQLDLPNDCEITYQIIIKAIDPIEENIEVEAAILRPNDVHDPDATNSDLNVPPTNAHYECDNNGLPTPCNNIKTNNGVIFKVNNLLITNPMIRQRVK